MKVEVEYTLGEQILKEIDSLTHYSQVPQINIRSFYLQAFNKYLLEDWNPLFIKAMDEANNQLIGIVPLMYKTRKRKKLIPYKIVRFMGSTFSDFHDVYAKQENKKQLIEFAFHWLFERFKWQEMILDDLLDSSNLISPIHEYLLGHRVNFSHHVGMYFYINLKRSWDEIKKDTSKSFVWKNIRLAKNRISKAGNWNIEYNPKLNEEEILKRIIPIHIDRQKYLGRESNLNEQKYISAYKDIIGKALFENKFNTYWLKFEGEYIGYMLGFNLNGVFYWWNTAFLEEFKAFYPSRFLQYHVLLHMHENNYKEFNFMRGESGYKDKWTKTTRANHRFRIYNHQNWYGKFLGLLDKNFK